MEKNIESHLKENRVFKPARAVATNARINSLEQYRRLYRESIDKAGEILGAGSERAELAAALAEGPGMEGAFREMVRRRKIKRLGELSSTATSTVRAATKPPSSGKASRAKNARSLTNNCTVTFAVLRMS